MAINYTYPEKDSPIRSDEFLIIDSVDNSTKKVTVDNILSLGTGGDVGVAAISVTSPIVKGADNTNVALSLDTIPTTKGGTGLTTIGDTKNVLQVNSAGDGLEYVDVVEGSKHVIQDVRFLDAVEKGDPVYIESYNVGQELTQVGKADASDPSKMPAYGIADATVSQNTNGTITAIGSFNGTFDSSYLTQNEVIYVDIAANDVADRPRLTSTKPAGEANLIQNIGFCSRSNANNGEIEVVAVGRTNATPNLDSAKIFLGDSSNHSVARAVTGEVTISNIGVTEVTGIDGNVSIQGYSPVENLSNAAVALTDEYFGKTLVLSNATTTAIITEDAEYPIGTEISLINSAGSTTIVVDGGNLNGNDTISASYGQATLKKIAAGEYVAYGDLA